jgi:S-adenosylmethionine:tRNA ribosyltransferase-isomerase
MRAIESSVSVTGHLNPYSGWTNKFIFPPYDFSVANCMITNFHMPESTLLMQGSCFWWLRFNYESIQRSDKRKIPFLFLWRCYVDFVITYPT